MVRAVGSPAEEHGGVDTLITSAGTVRPGHFQELDTAFFRDAMEVNYFGTLYAVQAVVPGMLDRGAGTLACISSAAGLYGPFGYTAYAPTKFAVRGLCESLRMELRPYGIQVSGICPADVDTPQLAMEKPFKPAELAALGETVKPSDARSAALEIVKGIEAGRPVIVPGTANRAVALLARTTPGLAHAHADHGVARSRRRGSPRP
ncbi:SDR family NAD(P)-dependent oxidoreductase [Streptomyces sp. WAC06614]|nr:SDR family NAD(P)-dependent oxidoreductase [Streptomyces sp. WAC06614]